MVAIATADREPDRTLAEAARLALNADELTVVVDNQVAASVLAKGNVERDAAASKRGHDGERRSVADVLGVLHVVRIAYRSDGIISRLPE
jgi:hypothetical protein